MPRTLAGLPALIGCFVVALLSGGCTDGDSNGQAELADFEPKLTIDLEGRTVSLPLDALDVWLTRSQSRPETYEIHGDGIAIFGTFPRDLRVGYEENWHLLVGKSIPISARGGVAQYEKPSVLTVPGIGQFRVVGGRFIVEEAKAGRYGQTPLVGRIELQVRAARGHKSLTGTFAVKAMTWS